MSEPEAQQAEKRCALLAGMEPPEYRVLENGLIRSGAVFGTAYARTPEEAEALCLEGQFDLVILGCGREGFGYPLVFRLRTIPGSRHILVLGASETDGLELERCLGAGADRTFVFPWSARTLVDFIYRMTALPESSDLEDRCLDLLREAGIGSRRKGARYICSALLMLYRKGLLPMKNVYVDIALQENTSPVNVEGAIRTVLQAAGREETNKVFLYDAVEKLKRTENRERDRFGF